MIRRLLAVAILIELLIAVPAELFAQELTGIVRASQNALGQGHLGIPGRPEISPNGKLVVFTSSASNLVTGDTNSNRDVFLYNTSTGLVKRINLGPNDAEANEDCNAPEISARSPNGFVAVVFDSAASNIARSRLTLLKQTSNRDVFFCLPDFSFNLCERLSLGQGEVEGDGDSTDPSVAIRPEPNRMLVAYRSEATNLVSGDTNGKADIFLATILGPADDQDGVFDHATDIVTTRISKAADPSDEPNDDSFQPQISGDGRFVVYESDATNLISGVTPIARQIYLYDVDKGTTTLVSKSSTGEPGNKGSRSASLSFRGTYVAYFTIATNIIDDGFVPSSDTVQVILYNTVTGKSERVNVSTSGEKGNGSPQSFLTPAVSPNGRFVLFSDTADNLVSDDGNGFADIFIRDRANSETFKISQGSDGSATSGQSQFAGYGQTGFNTKVGLTSFLSEGDNLISDDTENSTDVFVGSLTINPAKITKKTVIEVPADVTLPEARKVSVAMEEFKGVDLKSSAAVQIGKSAANLGALKDRVEYLVEVFREVNNKKTDRRRKIVKKVTAAFSNLKPGFVHIIRYQARVVRGKGDDKKIRRKTKFSPEERVLVE